MGLNIKISQTLQGKKKKEEVDDDLTAKTAEGLTDIMLGDN